jgi:hypothetical protein
MHRYNQDDPKSLEKYSSAVTLSDMEVFIFPELLYALVLANIMSPRLWKWRSDPWFDGIEKMAPQRRIFRLKQFIMDHFAFNLDLDTWGLTTKEKELARFSGFIAPDVLAKSNALFGYEGDKYYFDSDIRKHFGLDKYNSDIIPYWKTETLEAMEAFRHKPGYPAGAGECVSLSALYAAAAFVVAGIPLDDIFCMATPLHSQNYFDIGSGILSNNRRIITKTMWYNGTEVSGKARRALENEQVTIVSHCTGHVHSLFPEATIDPESFQRFSAKLRSFLANDAIDFEVLANFLRYNSKIQRCFQISHIWNNKTRYIESEKVFAFEHNSKSRVSDKTRALLLREIDEDEFYTDAIPGRLLLNELEEFFKSNKVSLDRPDTVEKLKKQLHHACYSVDQVIPELNRFCRIDPRLPDIRKKINNNMLPVSLKGVSTDTEAREKIASMRETNISCDLAFSAFRDMSCSPWKPFLKAALERNPVSVNGMKDLSIDVACDQLAGLPEESIYDDPFRCAQPDEVWNYRRGDGLEKAITLANVIRARDPGAHFVIKLNAGTISLIQKGGKNYSFASQKSVTPPEEKDFEF